jgi:hypothetical protein
MNPIHDFNAGNTRAARIDRISRGLHGLHGLRDGAKIFICAIRVIREPYFFSTAGMIVTSALEVPPCPT